MHTHAPQPLRRLVVLLEQGPPDLFGLLYPEFFAHEAPQVLPLVIDDWWGDHTMHVINHYNMHNCMVR